MIHDALPKQVWFVLAMVVALISLGVAANTRGSLNTDVQVLNSEGRPTAVQATPAATWSVRSLFPHPTATPTLRPSRSKRTPTPKPTIEVVGLVPVPTEAPYVGPDHREDHYWLQRPIGPGGSDSVARYYAYGSRQDGSYPVHHGVEFVNPLGTPVLAVADGQIVVAGDDRTVVYGARDGFYGQLIVLKLDSQLGGQPVYALYGHLYQIGVTVGQHVRAGQSIGLVGQEGAAEGPHLHFEVRLGANDYDHTVNPELWVVPRPGKGTLAGVLLDNKGVRINDEVRLVLTSAGGERAEVTTYPSVGVNADPAWLESFCIGDLTAGNWQAQAFVRNQLLQESFTIVAGQTTWLQLQLGQ